MNTSFTASPEIYRTERPIAWAWAGWIVPVLVLAGLITSQSLAPEWTQRTFTIEPFGLIEMIGFLFPLCTALIGIWLMTYRPVREDGLVLAVAICMVLGGIYVAGEEISWGQWFMGWSTPDYWTKINDQQETNLHNVSHWFDQKPRAILLACMTSSGIFGPVLILRQSWIISKRLDVLYPPLWLMGIAVTAVLCEIPQHIRLPFFYEQVDALRPGELQELFIFTFLLGYALNLRARIAAVS